MQTEYSFGPNYVLVGHSVGATLAFLTAIKGIKSHGIVPPKAFLGLSGIYDFPLIHMSHPEYEALTFNAMARGEEGIASPALAEAQAYKAAGVSRILLAHSKDDELVPWSQLDRMKNVLELGGEGYVQMFEIFGKHDDPWADGRDVARAVIATIEALAA